MRRMLLRKHCTRKNIFSPYYWAEKVFGTIKQMIMWNDTTIYYLPSAVCLIQRRCTLEQQQFRLKDTVLYRICTPYNVQCTMNIRMKRIWDFEKPEVRKRKKKKQYINYIIFLNYLIRESAILEPRKFSFLEHPLKLDGGGSGILSNLANCSDIILASRARGSSWLYRQTGNRVSIKKSIGRSKEFIWGRALTTYF